jgi:hypothetical protein
VTPGPISSGHFHVAGLGRKDAAAVTVALGHPRVGALIGRRANGLAGLRLDEGLEDDLHRPADLVDVATGTERVE